MKELEKRQLQQNLSNMLMQADAITRDIHEFYYAVTAQLPNESAPLNRLYDITNDLTECQLRMNELSVMLAIAREVYECNKTPLRVVQHQTT